MSHPGSERPTFEERLNDPLSHFPYKHDVALRAVDGDEAATVEVDATAAYIKAQEDYLSNPTEETREDERAAARALQTVRQARRVLRETPALMQALEKLAEEAEAAQDAELLDRYEQQLEQAIQAAQDAAAQLGLHPAITHDEQEG
jgi:hypothetical protein